MMRIGFVGAGNMARALAGGLRAAAAGGRVPTLVATDPVPAACEGFATATGGAIVPDLASLATACDVIVLAVKPQIMPEVLPKLALVCSPGQHLVISIAAGVTMQMLVAHLGEKSRLIRAMPNTPALVNRGATVLVAGGAASAADGEEARRLFEAVGKVWQVEDESLLDAVTAVSGSGPGFVFAWAEAMVDAARGAGLPADLALALVQTTLLGSAVLWDESGRSAAELRAMVTSPGGTTQAGLEALAKAGLSAAVQSAVEAAARRSRELS